jgi:DNA-binding FadR family transcriptional regulator
VSGTLAETVADRLLEAIIDGRFAPRSTLPPEGELASSNEVSRLTIREAIRILRTHNVVSIRRGRGTEVNPPEQWTSLHAMVRASAAHSPEIAERLLEARRMIEIGAVELAATRRTKADLQALDKELTQMRDAAAAADVAAFVGADIRFHQVIMAASGNVFIPLLLDTFGALLIEARRQTSAVPEIQRNAIDRHAAILAALRAGEPDAARIAMVQHMDQTQRDLRERVIGPAMAKSESELLAGLPPERPVSATALAEAVAGGRRLVVLDDDPTGTQTVSDIPVLTQWTVPDIRWALRQNTPAFFVLTNTRSLPESAAATRNREVAAACLDAAAAEGVDIAFASRSDSTLRGHFPLETDELSAVRAHRGQPVVAVLIVPAYLDAGRLTVNSVHWLRTAGGMLPVGSSEFARDATFGYQNSQLPDWVEEKTGGRVSAEDVQCITLTDLRTGGPEALSARLAGMSGGQYVVVDAVSDEDLKVLTLAILAAEQTGRRFLYRVGPSFVRARAGQVRQPPLAQQRIRELSTADTGAGGLVVVGSHVAQTTAQLEELLRRVRLTVVQVDVAALVDPDRAAEHVRAVVAEALDGLAAGHVALCTTRAVLTGATGAQSLAIASRVSAAVAAMVREIVASRRPAFVVAKGGITSSDVATDGLGIDRAWARGTLLAGIVSLWEPVAGLAAGLPYVVFAGNVGDEAALAQVVERLVES